MTVRAKFVCQGVRKFVYSRYDPETKTYEKLLAYDAEFSAVGGATGGTSKENEEFFHATPAGKINLSTIQSDRFVPGQSYYVDFTEAPE